MTDDVTDHAVYRHFTKIIHECVASIAVETPPTFMGHCLQEKIEIL